MVHRLKVMRVFKILLLLLLAIAPLRAQYLPPGSVEPWHLSQSTIQSLSTLLGATPFVADTAALVALDLDKGALCYLIERYPGGGGGGLFVVYDNVHAKDLVNYFTHPDPTLEWARYEVLNYNNTFRAVAAGGYINSPWILDGGVENVDVADSAIDSIKIAPRSIKGDNIKDATITGDKIAQFTITSGNIGENEIIAFNLGNNSVGTVHIQDQNVTTEKIKDLAVTTPKIDDLAVTSNKIAYDAVTGGKILDGTIDTEDIASDAITTDKILNGAVNTDDIATDAVTSSKIADDAVRTEHINANAVASTQIADDAIEYRHYNNNYFDNTLRKYFDGEDNYYVGVKYNTTLEVLPSGLGVADHAVKLSLAPEYPGCVYKKPIAGFDKVIISTDFDTSEYRNYYSVDSDNESPDIFDYAEFYIYVDESETIGSSYNYIVITFMTSGGMPSQANLDVTIIRTGNGQTLYQGFDFYTNTEDYGVIMITPNEMATLTFPIIIKLNAAVKMGQFVRLAEIIISYNTKY